MRLREPAADLAVCAAIASAVRDVPWPPEMAFLGEVGLAGELRAVPQVCVWAGPNVWANGSGMDEPRRFPCFLESMFCQCFCVFLVCALTSSV
jgi:hypothetical protein